MTRRPFRIHRAVVALLFAALPVLVSCELIDPSPGPHAGDAPTPPANRVIDRAIGAQLFDQLCSRCHGDSAQGTMVAASIRGIAGIGEFVSAGRGAMPAFPELSPADIRSIELYLGDFAPAWEALTGPPLFQAACARCHGDSAQGLSSLGPGLQRAADITATVREGKGKMPAFATLTDAQITSIEAFLNQVPFERTGRNLYNRYCVRCHGDDARGTTEHRVNIRGEDDYWEPVNRGKDKMPAFPELSRGDVTLIRNYVRTLP